MAKCLDKIVKVITTPSYFSNKFEETTKDGCYDSENKMSYYTDRAILRCLDIAKYPLMKMIGLVKSERATFKNTH